MGSACGLEEILRVGEAWVLGSEGVGGALGLEGVEGLGLEEIRGPGGELSSGRVLGSFGALAGEEVEWGG